MKNYIDRKEGGLIKLKKINDAYALIIKRFDPNTGKEIEEDIQSVDIDELTNQISELETQLEDCYQLLKDTI